MSSERLPGEAGGIQFASQTELVPTVNIVAEQQIQAGNERSTLFDKLRNKLTSIAVIGALAVGLVINPLVGEGSAQAANTETAVVGMPFEGNWAYPSLTTASCGPNSNQTSHPSCHDINSGDWSTDLYAASGTEVKLNIADTTGTLSLAWDTVTGTCGETRRVKISVDSTYIGRVSFTHLKDSASTAEAPTNGMVIGKIANLTCNPGGADKKHIHMEVDNSSTSTYACYKNYSTDSKTAGQLLAEGTNLGTIGSSNTGTKEVCTEASTPAPTPPQPDPLNLSFVRLNDARGNAWVDSYSEASGFQGLAENTNTNYPPVPGDGSVVPIFQPDGDLSFVNLSYPGHAQVVTYGEASGYKQVIENIVTAYPSVSGDGAVIPMYQFDGDLSFIRLNHPQGTEVIAYSQASGYQELVQRDYALYPPVETDGSVVPMYWLNDDLIMLRLNHYSGRVEMYAYGKSSGYRQTVNQAWLPYPALSAPGVAPGKNVIPLLHPQRGEISFVRLNHSSGRAEVITYGGAGFQQTTFQGFAGYPAVPGDGNVIPRYSN